MFLQAEVDKVGGGGNPGVLLAAQLSTQNTWELRAERGGSWMELRAGIGDHRELEGGNPRWSVHRARWDHPGGINPSLSAVSSAEGQGQGSAWEEGALISSGITKSSGGGGCTSWSTKAGGPGGHRQKSRIGNSGSSCCPFIPSGPPDTLRFGC